MAHTLKGLAQRALNVQNASNLLGVLRSAHLDLCELRTLLDLDSAELHEHPIALLWADKIASLTGYDGTSSMAAYDAVYALVDGDGDAACSFDCAPGECGQCDRVRDVE